MACGSVKGAAALSVGFVFSGSGTHWSGMGRSLYAESLAFRETFDRCAAHLNSWLPQPIGDVVFGEYTEADLQTLPFMSAGTFVIQMALVSFWQSHGIIPSAVMAHSLGGHAAVWAAGALSLEEACALLRLRCIHLSDLPVPGSMGLVESDEAAVRATLAVRFPSVEIAAVNGPRWITLAGPSEDVQAAVRFFKQTGTPAKMYAISHAFHSSLMDPVLPAYRAAVAIFGSRVPQIPLFTTAASRVAVVDANFWVDQLRGAMHFGRAYAAFRAHALRAIVEIGPDKAAERAVRENETGDILILASLSRSDCSQSSRSLEALCNGTRPID